jgi:hypothetical protein
MAHSPNKPDYVGQLLDYILPLPPLSPSTAPVTTVDEQALDRILAAVGKKFIPTELNRMALWTAIKQAAENKDNVDRFRSGPRTRAVVKSMKRIRKAADALATVIKENRDVTSLLADMSLRAQTTIKELIYCATHFELELSKISAVVRPRYNRIPSAREWLAGVELPIIFEEFFNRKAGRSRIDGVPGGPTVHFIAAVMSEIDSPLKRETIVRAMTTYSELRKLRRPVRQRAHALGKSA